jgi:D-glycero-alpha-D-manno-heptose-7-phosphate kinase
MIISRAPLRVSFFGGGTDYPQHFKQHGGAVLGTAIDQYAFMTAAPFRSIDMFDYRIRCTYREIELVERLEDLRHRPLREALRHCGFSRDIELHHIADLPAETGLGSSSSFVVCLLQALHALAGRRKSGLELAYEAVDFERRILGESVGCQDQTFAAVGGLSLIEFRREDDISVHPVQIAAQRMQELESCLMMFYSGGTRRAEDVVKLQLADAAANTDRYLRMRKQVDRAHAILTGNGSLTPFGELLDEAWREKRALHSVISNGLIDKMYDQARAAGAIGGKLLGAGGGGFLLAFVPPERQTTVRNALAGHSLLLPHINAPGADIIFDGRAMRPHQ